MNDRTTSNPTPAVQVKEIGIQEQAPLGKLVIGAAALAALAAGVTSVFGHEKSQPETNAESSKSYLRTALAQASTSDFALRSKAKTRNAGKKTAEATKKSQKEIENIGMKLGDQLHAAKAEGKSVFDAIKSSGPEIEKLITNEFLPKLREFGDEAKTIADQSKTKGSDLAHRAHTDLLPKAKGAAHTATETGKIRATELTSQTIDKAGHLGADAQASVSDVAQIVETKRRVAVESVQRGGRETRSLLIWMAAAGTIIYSVMLNEEQQAKVRDAVTDVIHEVKAMMGS